MRGASLHASSEFLFGEAGFGDTIWDWIASDYGQVREFRATGRQGFEAILLRRRDAGGAAP